MIKEIPRIFSGEMVRAILDDLKTQTRRLDGLKEINKNPNDWTLEGRFTKEIINKKTKKKYPVGSLGFRNLHTKKVTPIIPRYRVGDLIWTKETYHQPFRADETNNGCVYRADYLKPTSLDPNYYFQNVWKSSIFMPKSAARIWLEIVAFRVERAQDISDKDALAEGIPYCPTTNWTYCNRFGERWNKINGKRQSWETNPWLNVVTFKRIK